MEAVLPLTRCFVSHSFGIWINSYVGRSVHFDLHSFIMVINKNTGEYKNFYRDTFKNPKQIEHMALLLDRHKNMQ